MLALCLYVLTGWQSLSGEFLSHLGEGDRLLVAYDSTGCFHHRRFNYVFTRRNGLEVEITDVTSTPAGPPHRLELTRDDEDGLKRLLEYYADLRDPGESTTRVRGLVCLIRPGRFPVFGPFFDASIKLDWAEAQRDVGRWIPELMSEAEYLRLKRVVTFESLLHRARTK